YNDDMDAKLFAIFSEVPPKPDYNPVRKAIEASKDKPEVAAALKLFSSMPSSTGVLANPVRHHHKAEAPGATLELDIRSFALRGKLFEEDIISGKADTMQVIFVGLFGRFPTDEEAVLLQQYLSKSFAQGLEACRRSTTEFLQKFPGTPPDVAIQHWASI